MIGISFRLKIFKPPLGCASHQTIELHCSTYTSTDVGHGHSIGFLVQSDTVACWSGLNIKTDSWHSLAFFSLHRQKLPMHFLLVQRVVWRFFKRLLRIGPTFNTRCSQCGIADVDFGAELFSNSVELYKSVKSSLPTNVELTLIVEDLSQISAGLAATNGFKQEQLTKDEVALN